MIKITIPGPMTIKDTVGNTYYKNEADLYADLIVTIQKEIAELIKHGCKIIQIDEPVLARYPKEALQYGISNIEKCFENVGDNILKGVHICCGYPDKLEETDYPKADPNAYFTIAEKLNNSKINFISIEDAHRKVNDDFFKIMTNKIIILGVLNISTIEIESENEIEERVKHILKYIPKERLWLAPDCGLGMLPKDIAIKKLKNMVNVTKKL